MEGTIQVAPSGIAARDVRIWIGSQASTLDGPLIFYWHGTSSSPNEATVGIGTTQINAIKAQGGIVAAPFHDPAAGQFPWFLVTGTGQNDLRVADEVLACAIQRVGVDLRRIHVMGMSAGGLMTSQMSYRRSGYIASAAPYSGGLVAGTPPNQNPANRFAAMIFHGGPTDVVVINFQTASEAYRNALVADAHFAFICNHGQGHTIPTAAAPSVWRFFQDHRYGTTPSPYASGLPQGFPAYCAL